MGATYTTLDTILEAFRTRLQDQIEEFGDDGSCFICDAPIPTKVPPGEPFCTISLGNSQFPEPFFAGGGASVLNEELDLTVTIFRRCFQDQPGRIDKVVLSERLGLLKVLKLNVLKALVASNWEPTTYTGDPILRDQPRPVSASPPLELVNSEFGEGWYTLAISFALSFDWDLS